MYFWGFNFRADIRGSTRLSLARVRLDLAWGSTIESGHIARIVTQGSTRLGLKLSFAWLEDLIGTAQVSDLLEQGSMLSRASCKEF